MSAAAEDAVRACLHPKVKGCARALLKKIAELIPEGETMTPPLAIDDLDIGYYDQAIRQARDLLADDVKVLRIVGGGRGRRACYELLLLSGTGADLVLPLRADLQPVPRASARPIADGPSLFDTPETPVSPAPADLRANNIGDFHRRWWTKVGDFHRRWRQALSNIGDFHRRWWTKVGDFGDFHRRWVRFRADHIGDFHRRSHPLDVDPRAREYVHTSKELHTPAVPPLDVVRPPPCRLTGTAHAWCGRVCVPTGLHQEWLRKGHAASWLTAFYTRTCAAIPTGERIVVDDYKFWRAAMKADLVRADAAATSGEAASYTCPHTDSPCAQPNWRCRQRTALEAAKAEDQRRQGTDG
jgi:hypothetical protein